MRWLLLFLALGLVCVVLVFLFLPPPEPTPVEHSAPPAVKPKPRSLLQADAAGSYVPGYAFSVNGFRFTGFSISPDTSVSFVSMSGTQRSGGCPQAVIRPDAVHLTCDGPPGTTITIDGKFLTRLATTRLESAVLSAVVTVRSGGGDVLYSARDRFAWQPPH